jgi:hypothetical protein
MGDGTDHGNEGEWKKKGVKEGAEAEKLTINYAF